MGRESGMWGEWGAGHYLHNFLIDFLIRVLNILVQVVSAPDPRAWHMNLTIMECINPTNIYSKAP